MDDSVLDGSPWSIACCSVNHHTSFPISGSVLCIVIHATWCPIQILPTSSLPSHLFTIGLLCVIQGFEQSVGSLYPDHSISFWQFWIVQRSVKSQLPALLDVPGFGLMMVFSTYVNAVAISSEIEVCQSKNGLLQFWHCVYVAFYTCRMLRKFPLYMSNDWACLHGSSTAKPPLYIWQSHVSLSTYLPHGAMCLFTLRSPRSNDCAIHFYLPHHCNS